MTSLAYAVGDEGDGDLEFAIVLDEDGFEYAWPSGREPLFTAEERIELLGAETSSFTAEQWQATATYNIGADFKITPWVEVDGNRAAVVRLAENELDAAAASAGYSDSVDAGIAQAASSMPLAFGSGSGADDDFEADPDQMLLFVAQALGEIDPDGPNGFILRALDGNPLPGDEDLYPVFGPVPVTAEAAEEA